MAGAEVTPALLLPQDGVGAPATSVGDGQKGGQGNVDLLPGITKVVHSVGVCASKPSESMSWTPCWFCSSVSIEEGLILRLLATEISKGPVSEAKLCAESGAVGIC